jgi:enoyl-CoA hydratase/carnithine racemase
VPALILGWASIAASCGQSEFTVALGKEAFYRPAELDLAAAYAYTSEVMAESWPAQDAEEGIDAFIHKRKPVWKDT